MGGGIADGALTRWRKAAAGWVREVYAPARVEAAPALEFGAKSGATPTDAGELKAYVMCDCDVRPGDWVAGGEVEASAPTPPAARRVRKVQAYTLGTVAHHCEVEAQ
jgi:hypothetical protein